MTVAVEDHTARRNAELLVGKQKALGTVELMVCVLQAGLLTIAESDAIKADWETNHRFALPQFKSFKDKLPGP